MNMKTERENGTEYKLFLRLFAVAVLIIVAAFGQFCSQKCAGKCRNLNITTTTANISVNRCKITTMCQKRCITVACYTTNAENTEENGGEDGAETLPDEYGGFTQSIPEDVADRLPDGAFSPNAAEVGQAASEIGSVAYLFSVISDSFGASFSSLLPTFATLVSCVLLAALCHSFTSGFAISSTVSFAVKLCSFCVISATAVSSLARLESYFDSLFNAVAAFVPLSGVLMAMGGNISGAASGTATLSATLAVCEFFCAKTVIPVFCICLSLSLVTVFDGHGANAGRNLAATVKKWYSTALGFIMMILTVSIVTQSVISSKIDNAAMRGAKYAASSFIPVVGGTLSGTLGTLVSSVELLRGAVGIVGIGVILLMLIPVIIELALLRGIFSLTAFLAGSVSASGEQGLLTSISELYGYLEGIAALSAAVFIIAFAVFAASSGAVA